MTVQQQNSTWPVIHKGGCIQVLWHQRPQKCHPCPATVPRHVLHAQRHVRLRQHPELALVACSRACRHRLVATVLPITPREVQLAAPGGSGRHCTQRCSRVCDQHAVPPRASAASTFSESAFIEHSCELLATRCRQRGRVSARALLSLPSA